MTCRPCLRMKRRQPADLGQRQGRHQGYPLLIMASSRRRTSRRSIACPHKADAGPPRKRVTVISIDLAYKRYSDIGVVALTQVDEGITVEVIRLANLGLSGQPAAPDLARCLATLAQDRGAQMMLIDGPQAWKSPSNGLEHSRRCERELNTPGKTGLPGNTKPANYCGFIAFSIELFDELARHGWPRLTAINPPGPACRITIESFPTSAWRKLGSLRCPEKQRRPRNLYGGNWRSFRASMPCRFGLI